MENTAICGNVSNEIIRREEHSASNAEDFKPLPSTTIRSDCRFALETKFDYYVLGYTIADGCVEWYPNRTKRGFYEMSWTSIDIDVINRLHNYFGGNGSIYNKPKNKQNVVTRNGNVISQIKHQNQAYVYKVVSKELCVDFMSYGVLPRKTYDPQFPDLTDVSDCNVWALIAGICDGDGCFWYNNPTPKKQAGLHQSIRSYSKVFLTKLQQLLKTRFNLIGSISTSDATPRLLYAHRPSLIMYENFPKEFLIKRKAAKVEEFIKLRGGWNQLKRKCRQCGDRFIKYRHNQLYCNKCYNKK